MPFEGLFRTRHWANLWRNRLPDLQSTKNLASNTIFVAIDTEPWVDGNGVKRDDKEACEIGLAFLFPVTDARQSPKPPRTFEQTCNNFSVSSHCIRIGDRKQFLGERFWKGGEEIIPSLHPNDVEEALVNLVQTTQQQLRSDGDPATLTLVGFDLHAEFLILSHNYSRFLRCFTSWVDVQDLAKELTTVTQAPSLQNTLIAFGFECVCPTIAKNSKRHNAGNDAMRTICALVILLFYQPRGEDLYQTCSQYHSRGAKQRRAESRQRLNLKRNDIFRKRYPSPREKYPFQAKVDLPEATLLEPPDAEALCEYFRFTGRAATANAKDTIAYGTRIVGGVSPGKGGQTHLDLPVFNTVREAVQEVKPQVSAVFVPAQGAAAAIIESIEAEVPLVVSVAEHIPVHDMLRVHEVLQTQSRTRLVGPNCPGIIAPEQCRVGIMPYKQYRKGCVGIVSKSGTLSYEAVGATSKAGLGQSVVMGMGGDLLPGTTLVDGLELFFEDDETKGIIVIGEIGGEAELRAAEVIQEYRTRTANPKPIIAMVAGRTAPEGRVMGHAGAVLMPRDVSAAEKADALSKAGAIVVPHPGVMGETMKELLGM
ncbi:hypothetical protein V2A60_006996 [Cordyceps javanica]